jgi:hypothetical protein
MAYSKIHKLGGVAPTFNPNRAAFVTDLYAYLTGTLNWYLIDDQSGTTGESTFSNVGTDGTLVTGTADSGSGSTLVDSTLTAADDTYNGWYLRIVGGSGVGESAVITDFDQGTNTLSFTALNNAGTVDNTSVYRLTNKEYILDFQELAGDGLRATVFRAYTPYNHTGYDPDYPDTESTARTIYYALKTTEFDYWVYGDDDHLIFLTRTPGNAKAGNYIGCYDSNTDETWALTLNSETAGLGVVIEVDDSSIFTTDDYVTILEKNKETINTYGQRCKITGTSSGTPDTITVEELFTNIAIGSVVGKDPCRFRGNRASTSAYPNLYGIHRGWTYAASHTGAYTSDNVLWGQWYPDPYSEGDPDNSDGYHYLWPIGIRSLVSDQGDKGTLKNVYVHGGNNVIDLDTITVTANSYTIFKAFGWWTIACAILEP